MTINNNLNSMISSQGKIEQMAGNIAQVANTVADPALQEVSQELIDSIVNQIPEVIAYQANAQGAVTQQAVSDVLLNIKA